MATREKIVNMLIGAFNRIAERNEPHGLESYFVVGKNGIYVGLFNGMENSPSITDNPHGGGIKSPKLVRPEELKAAVEQSGLYFYHKTHNVTGKDMFFPHKHRIEGKDENIQRCREILLG